jgi:transcriptional antiterminator NusG
MRMTNMGDWYVLHVKTGKEIEIRNTLARHLPQCKTMVPMRIMMERKDGVFKRVTRDLFPGYVFIHTFMDAAMYYSLTGIPSVIKILGGDRGPQPVPEEEISPILRWHGSGDPLGVSEMFIEGGKVKVIDGPLKDMEGQILKVDARRQRAKVNISLMGQPRIVELAIKMITKSEPEAC